MPLIKQLANKLAERLGNLGKGSKLADETPVLSKGGVANPHRLLKSPSPPQGRRFFSGKLDEGSFVTATGRTGKVRYVDRADLPGQYKHATGIKEVSLLPAFVQKGPHTVKAVFPKQQFAWRSRGSGVQGGMLTTLQKTDKVPVVRMTALGPREIGGAALAGAVADAVSDNKPNEGFYDGEWYNPIEWIDSPEDAGATLDIGLSLNPYTGWVYAPVEAATALTTAGLAATGVIDDKYAWAGPLETAAIYAMDEEGVAHD